MVNASLNQLQYEQQHGDVYGAYVREKEIFDALQKRVDDLTAKLDLALTI